MLVPYMCPGIVATLIWIYLYSPAVGPLTPFFKLFGIDANFYGSSMIWVSVGNLMAWGGIGFNMLIVYGALQAVPRDIFDSARVDGASEWRIAWSIKVPYGTSFARPGEASSASSGRCRSSVNRCCSAR